MARKRLWAKFTLEFADHPKIAGLSDGAFRMLVEMILWSRQGLTDGFIPTAVAHRKWHTDSLTDSGYESLNELCTNDLRSPSLSEVEGGYLIHDFVEVQGSRESVERRSEKNRDNVKARWERNEVQTVDDSNTNRSAENREQRTEKELLATRADVRSVFDAFNDSLTARGVKAKKPTKTALDAARRMIDIDGHTVDQITRCIQWVTNSDFWAANILSLDKLRSQYDQLRLQAQRDQGTAGSTQRPMTVSDALLAKPPVGSPEWEEAERARRAAAGE
jgi:hypothetical protein